MNHQVIAIANQKGGVGKSTSVVNLAPALRFKLPPDSHILIVDFDPQSNTTQASSVDVDAVKLSVADLIRDRALPDEAAIYRGSEGIDILPATPALAQIGREMISMTNSELRLAQRIGRLKAKYDIILIDAAPQFGPLLNSVLNAADFVIIPVDSGVFALQGIKTLLAEIEEIRGATNRRLQVLGYLLTLFDPTRIGSDVLGSLIENFGDQVFKTKIRRSVKLREAPALGRTIYHHAPQSTGAEDYLRLADEVLERLASKGVSHV